MTALDKVSNAARAKRELQATLEAELRAEMGRRLEAADFAIIKAVGEALAEGNSKANIGRALGTKDYGTYNAFIVAAKQLNPTTDVTDTGLKIELIDYENNTILVEYEGHSAEFRASVMDSGTLFTTHTPLWDAEYTVRNQVVDQLDVRDDTWMYDEVLAWWNANVN